MKHLRLVWLGSVLGVALGACGGKTTVASGTDGVAGAGGSTSGAGTVAVGTSTSTSTSASTSGSSTAVGAAGLGGMSGFGGAFGAGGATGFGGLSGVGGGPDVGVVTSCMPPYPAPVLPTNVLISDFEGTSTVAWAGDNDGRGTTLLSFEPCGTSGKGMHFVGKGHTEWGAIVAAALVSPTQPVDVRAFRGVRFVVTSTGPTVAIVKIENPFSNPTCGRCDDKQLGRECYSGFIKNVSLLRESMTTVVIPWSDFFPQSWGYRPPGVDAFDPRNLVSLAFAFDVNIDFDVCIDDIALVP